MKDTSDTVFTMHYLYSVRHTIKTPVQANTVHTSYPEILSILLKSSICIFCHCMKQVEEQCSINQSHLQTPNQPPPVARVQYKTELLYRISALSDPNLI